MLLLSIDDLSISSLMQKICDVEKAVKDHTGTPKLAYQLKDIAAIVEKTIALMSREPSRGDL